MNLIEMLREYGASDELIALAEQFAARADEGTEAMSDEDLASLLAGLVALAEDEEVGVGLLLAAAETADLIRGEQTIREEAAEAEEQAAAEAIARLRGEDPEANADGDADEDGADGDGSDADAEGDDADGADGEDGADEGAEDADREPVLAGGVDYSRSARRQRARQRQPQAASDVPTERARITLAADVPGHAAGAAVEDLAAVDRALVARHQNFRRSSATRGRENILVASIEGNYPVDRRLGDNAAENGRLVSEAIMAGRQPTALAAAGGRCAPLSPYYGVPILGDDRRPVRDALVGFQAGAVRGGMVQIAPPILPDLAGSSIIWTVENDADPGTDGPATKPCLRVECGTPRESYMYAVPVCLEFGNFLARTYGELTEAWSTLSMVAHARLAEQTLLARMKALSTQPNEIPTVVSGVIDTLVALDQAATGVRSRHRLPESFPFRAVGPETWRFQARTNMARALPGGSFQENLALADAAINAWFASRNISVTWTPDLGVIGQQASATPLAEVDPSTEWALYPEGSFLFLDGGRLDLGVVRDSTLNGTNDFQTFAETFEGLHFVGTEALWLTIDVCPSGAVNGTLDPAALCATYT